MAQRRLATCPTCGCGGEFELLGEQNWPPEIAQKLGLPATIRLWSCPCCMTTVSEPELLPYGAKTASSTEEEIGTDRSEPFPLRFQAVRPAVPSLENKRAI